MPHQDRHENIMNVLPFRTFLSRLYQLTASQPHDIIISTSFPSCFRLSLNFKLVPSVAKVPEVGWSNNNFVLTLTPEYQ